MKKYESNGNITENPFEVNLVKENGCLESYYLLKGEVREKITLSDLVNEQVDFVKKNCVTEWENIGNWARIGLSGDSARIGSSGNLAQIGSSGDWAQIGSSGNSARIGSSGNWARIGSSGNLARIGSSGNSARIGSSGNSARIGSSGNLAQIGSSGDWAQIGSSGDSAQIGSSGDWAQIGSSGDSARIGSSGNWAQIGSSGDSAQIELSGCDGVAFACGYLSAIKAKKDTWISLCEYKENGNGGFVPSFALSAQVGNPDYVDCFGKTLSENDFYILRNKKFTPIIFDDGMLLLKKMSKIKDGIEIIKCTEISDTIEIFCVRKGELSAHGKTLRVAMSDLLFKEKERKDKSEIVAKIKETGFVTREDYRCITGACSYGMEQFAKEHGYENVEKVPLEELLSKLDDRYYGAQEFKGFFKEYFD